MSFLGNMYEKSVADNERNLRFLEDYLNSLKLLDFSVYRDKLNVPTLVPIGSRIFFRGEIKHTNEVTVALGADYFVKCSMVQADILRHHRIKDAESKLELFKKEKEYLENQLSFTQQNIFEKNGQEIVEVFTEEEDKAWRKKHRENVREYKQGEAKQIKPQQEITDDELWTRLEELELEEELENELLDNYNEIKDKRKENSFLVNQEHTLVNTFRPPINVEAPQTIDNNKCTVIKENKTCLRDEKESNEAIKSKLDLLQQVLDKQNLLEDKLLEIKNRDRQHSKTENDLMAKLDEIEQLEELEDEMDRLKDILETEHLDSDDDETIDQTQTPSKKSIYFADELHDTAETIHITFKHSDVEPSNTPYNPEQGISKPSDIYETHSHLFNNGKPSILKKSKYEYEFIEDEIPKKQVQFSLTEDSPDLEVHPLKEIIVIKDVVETNTNNRSNIDTEVRPSSLFKKRRMQNKS